MEYYTLEEENIYCEDCFEDKEVYISKHNNIYSVINAIDADDTIYNICKNELKLGHYEFDGNYFYEKVEQILNGTINQKDDRVGLLDKHFTEYTSCYKYTVKKDGKDFYMVDLLHEYCENMFSELNYGDTNSVFNCPVNRAIFSEKGSPSSSSGTAPTYRPGVST